MNRLTIELPEPGSATPDDYAAICRRFVAHARNELSQGNRLQASEKVWGAANYALKAVAAQRGWRHRGQRNVFAVADQLAAERKLPALKERLMMARAIHFNFYENDLEATDIEEDINSVERYIADLDSIRATPPEPFRIANERDRNRIARLVGRTFPIGADSEMGFVQPTGPDDESGPVPM